MNKDIVELQEDVSNSPLYSEDLAPVPVNKRTWNKWNLAAIWKDMAIHSIFIAIADKYCN